MDHNTVGFDPLETPTQTFLKKAVLNIVPFLSIMFFFLHFVYVLEDHNVEYLFIQLIVLSSLKCLNKIT